MSADKITVILGPTASGKTDYAIALAQKTQQIVISADSRQVYAGMNIGTAKPEDAWRDAPHDILTPDSVQSTAHYLLNIRTPDNPLTLAGWQAAAFTVIDEVRAQGNSPVLVGGTMLYIDSIIYNYDIPQVPPDTQLRAALAGRTPAELYQELLTHDPAAAEFIEPHHTQRIIRALEVIRKTGQPFSRLRQRRPSKYTFTVLGLFPGWEELERRIWARAEGMFAHGLLEEAEKLERNYGGDLPLLQTMGYKEAALVSAGTVSREEALAAFCQAQLRYARRQMSWWKNRQEIRWIASSDSLSNF